MYVKFEDWTYGGKEIISQYNLDQFLETSFRSKDYYHDNRDSTQIKAEGTLAVLVGVIKVLLKKNLLSVTELEEMLPNKNYIKVISISEEYEV